MGQDKSEWTVADKKLSSRDHRKKESEGAGAVRERSKRSKSGQICSPSLGRVQVRRL